MRTESSPVPSGQNVSPATSSIHQKSKKYLTLVKGRRKSVKCFQFFSLFFGHRGRTSRSREILRVHRGKGPQWTPLLEKLLREKKVSFRT
jgi:hypothetical protein